MTSVDRGEAIANTGPKGTDHHGLHQRLQRLRDTIREPRRWISPWFAAYALLGAISSGVLPILLPLMIVGLTHRLSWVAYVMGGYNLGLLTSPLWGSIADQRHAHRALFFGGFLALMGALAAMPFLPEILPWTALSFLAGAGTAAVATVATLFVVEFNPQDEWEPRIGWLQTFNGGGQVAGLLLAGIFVSDFRVGLYCSAAALLPALWLGARGLPVAAKRHARMTEIGTRMRHDMDWRLLATFGHAELQGGGLLRFSHHLSLGGLRHLGAVFHSHFGRFIFSWFTLSFGVAAFFAYFPVALQKAYNVAPGLTSLTYAVAAAAALILYMVGAQLSGHYGAGRVYRWALLMRLLGFAMLFVVFFLPIPKILMGLAGFVCIIMAWPLLSIAGTDLTAHLTPVSQGAGMGLFNAAAAVATVIGTFLSGPLIHFLGYPALSAIALLGISVAWLSSLGLSTTVATAAH